MVANIVRLTSNMREDDSLHVSLLAFIVYLRISIIECLNDTVDLDQGLIMLSTACLIDLNSIVGAICSTTCVYINIAVNVIVIMTCKKD